MKLSAPATSFALLLSATSALAQAPVTARDQGPAPIRLHIDGELRTADGAPRGGSVLLAAAIYADRTGTTPVWIEYQQVPLDPAGRYALSVGATLDDGVPAEVFSSDTPARWLGIAVDGEPEHQRVMLVTAPYAMRAREADTLAGRPASEFVLAETLRADVKSALREAGSERSVTDPVVSATPSSLARFADAAGTVGDSNVFDNGGNIGIGTLTPNSIWSPTLQLRGAFGGIAVTSTAAGGGSFSIGSNVQGGQRKLSFFDETAGAYRMTIAQNGNLGVGTVSPASAWSPTLQVSGVFGGLALTSTAVGGGTFSIGSNVEGGQRKLSFFDEDAGAHRMTITRFGSVGIGTTSPTSAWAPMLHISGPFGGLAMTSTAVGGGTFSIGSNAEGGQRKLSFYDETAAAYRMTIGNTGNVGIGTTAPGSPLDLAGAFTQRGTSAPAVAPAGQGRFYYDTVLNRFRVSQNGGAYADLVGGGGGGLTLPFTSTTSSASTLFDITQTGSGGIARFVTQNPANGSTGVFIERNGTGIALQARNVGTSGEAAIIQIDNSGNPSTALSVSVNGTGNGAVISSGSMGVGMILSGATKALQMNGRFQMNGANLSSGDTILAQYGYSIVEVICNNPGAACASDATVAQITLPSDAELGSIIWITTIDPNGVQVNNLRGGGTVTVSQNVVRGFVFWGGSGGLFPPPAWRPFF